MLWLWKLHSENRMKPEGRETSLYQLTTSGHSETPKANKMEGATRGQKGKVLIWVIFKMWNIVIYFEIIVKIQYPFILKKNTLSNNLPHCKKIMFESHIKQGY